MELYELTDKAIDQIYREIDTEDPRINAWEHNFLENTAMWWERTRKLSDDQKLTLGKIWDKLT
jgi:hypothetical protein